MAGAQLMKRVPFIKFPQRHPKPSDSSSRGTVEALKAFISRSPSGSYPVGWLRLISPGNSRGPSAAMTALCFLSFGLLFVFFSKRFVRVSFVGFGGKQK